MNAPRAGRPGALGLLILTVCLVLGWSSAALAQQDADRAQILDWYRKGFEAYDNNNLEEAALYFEQIMHADPSERVALEIRERISRQGVETFVDMLNRGGNVARFAQYILDTSKLGGVERVTDPDRIRGWVRDTVEGTTFEKRWAALIKLDAKVGPFSTPDFVPYLVSNNETYKTNAIVALRHMGEQMALPVIRILDAGDPELRRQAAIILGHLRDHRAVPALARLAQDPNEDRIVVRYAEQAIVNTAGEQALATDFKVHYLRVARQFYHRDRSVMNRIGAGDVVWTWNDGAPSIGTKLHARSVPNYLYNEIQAERACWTVLNSDPEDSQAWSLLLSSTFAQVVETRKIIEAVQMNPDRGVEQSEMEMLEKNQAVLAKADALARSAGLPFVYTALDGAIKDRNTLVGIQCIQALSEMESRHNDPARPIISALHTADKRLRYHAALALARIDPLREYAGSKDVVPALEAALGETGDRSILVITDDQVARNQFRGQLERLGYAPYFADTGWDGVERAKRFPSHDLVILDTRLGVHPIDVRTGRADPRAAMNGGQADDPQKNYESGVYYVTVLELLERDFRTKNLPVVLLTDSGNRGVIENATRGGKHRDRVKGFMDRPVRSEDYGDLLSRTLGNIQNDFKARSIGIATAAARALADLDIDHSIYRVADATEGLIGTLERTGSERDELRIQSLRALGKIADPRALGAMLRVFQESTASDALRVAAADAMGSTYQSNRIAPSGDSMEAFQGALAGGSISVRFAVARALGRARISPGMRWKTFQSNPVEVESPGE